MTVLDALTVGFVQGSGLVEKLLWCCTMKACRPTFRFQEEGWQPDELVGVESHIYPFQTCGNSQRERESVCVCVGEDIR